MITEYIWWPLNTPVPDGWRAVENQRISHHHTYAVLLEFAGNPRMGAAPSRHCAVDEGAGRGTGGRPHLRRHDQ